VPVLAALALLACTVRGGFNGGVLAGIPLPGGNGWVEYAVPVVPTS
jgi:hypothetical protein